MSIDLPAPISDYFKAQNAHDIDAMLAQFDDEASVRDEGQVHHGRPAIRAWMEDVTQKYHPTVEVKDVRGSSDRTTVSGLLSGDFPGSPILLDHTFRLSGRHIIALEIE
jgi:uncharacterized protein (TIGR02246 family)